MKPLISYLVTTHNENESLKELFDLLFSYKENNEIVFLDDFSTNPSTIKFYNDLKWAEMPSEHIQVHQHPLNNNYAKHKNYGKSLCKGKYVCQLDADELPSEYLLEVLPDIIKENPTIELFWIPRVNLFKGVTVEHCKQWAWVMDMSPTFNEPRINFPDYQTRLFKNKPYIKWDRPLHEKIIGNANFCYLPKEENFAIYHNKTIEKQIETNLRYNKQFSPELNRGYKT